MDETFKNAGKGCAAIAALITAFIGAYEVADLVSEKVIGIPPGPLQGTVNFIAAGVFTGTVVAPLLGKAIRH